MKIYALPLLLILAVSCNGQNISNTNGVTVHQTTTENYSGLKVMVSNVQNKYGYQNQVLSSLKDKNGNIWFATTQGVWEFNGNLFLNYKTMDGLSVENIACMTTDNNGNIWFGTEGGAIKYDGKTFSSLRINEPFTGSSLSYDVITASLNYSRKKPVTQITQDKNGIYWLVTNGPGVYRYDGKNLSNLVFDKCISGGGTEPDGNGVFRVFADSKGNCWFYKGGCGNCHYLYRLDAAKAIYPCINGTCKHDLTNEQQLTAHKKEIASCFTEVTTRTTQSIDFASDVFEDKTGNVWFGTWDSGVYKYDGTKFTHLSGKDGFKTSAISKIYQDKSGNIWFGTSYKSENDFKGEGVFRYNTVTGALTHFTSKDGLNNKGVFSSNSASDMVEDNNGKMWFISDGGGVSYYDGKVFKSFSVADGLISDNVKCISKDNNGNIWFGTWGIGICRYDESSKKIISYTDSLQKK
ncbi:hypothetical protein LBMAG27_19950 [Bacteroidota bacterium]|nr:hypothetical protein LBMAG27_19950 [Bacteroidota bacterium]